MTAYDEIEIEDMEWNEELRAFTFACPCGDVFQITKVREKERGRASERVSRCRPRSSLISARREKRNRKRAQKHSPTIPIDLTTSMQNRDLSLRIRCGRVEGRWPNGRWSSEGFFFPAMQSQQQKGKEAVPAVPTAELPLAFFLARLSDILFSHLFPSSK